MTPAAETVHACPRCYQTLCPAQGRPEEGAAALLLACPESYCDYVLVLTHEERFSARKWSWPDLFRMSKRAAG